MPSYIVRVQGKKGLSWRVRFPTGEKHADGKPVVHCKSFPYKKQATEYLETLKEAKKTGAAVVESEQTLGEFFEEYLASTDLKPKTLASYREIFRLYLSPLERTPLKLMTPRKVQTLYNQLRKTLSPRTVRLTHSVLHSCLNHAITLRLIRSNPTTGVKLPKKSEPDISFLHGPEIRGLLEELAASPYLPLFELLLATGLRPGEARALKWSDVNLKKRTLRIERTISDEPPWSFEEPKTSKAKRTLPIPSKTADMLTLLKAEQGKRKLKLGAKWEDFGLVFTTDKGEPLARRNLAARHLKPALKRLADKLYPNDPEQHQRITGCGLYGLRHSHATLLIEQGVNVRTVSERLGHKDIEITLSTYVHVTPQMEERAIEVTESALYS